MASRVQWSIDGNGHELEYHVTDRLSISGSGIMVLFRAQIHRRIRICEMIACSVARADKGQLAALSEDMLERWRLPDEHVELGQSQEGQTYTPMTCAEANEDKYIICNLFTQESHA